METLPVSDWKDIQLLAYLVKRYKQAMGHEFAFSFNNSAPGKCTEMVMIKKIQAMLQSNDSELIKEYIDWVYDKKIIPNKVKIKTIGYFITPGIGNEFLYQRKEKNKITKNTELPACYQQAISDLDLSLSTYGDLAFVQQAVKEAPGSREQYAKALNRLYILGLDPQVLERL